MIKHISDEEIRLRATLTETIKEMRMIVAGIESVLGEQEEYGNTTYPKKEWVGLTEAERRGLREWQKVQEELGAVWAPMMLYLYEAIEAKLKEKNCG